MLGAKLIPADLPYPGIKARSPALQADSLPAEPQRKPQDYWSEYPMPSPTDLPYPGFKPESPVAPALPADSLLLSHQGNLSTQCD